MYWYRDRKKDIPNTFAPDIIENKVFSIPIVINLIDKGFIKRKDVPVDVLKRVDTEIKFQLDPTVKNIPNFFASNIKDKWFSKNDIIECLKFGSIRISQLTCAIAIRVDKLDEYNRCIVNKLDELE